MNDKKSGKPVQVAIADDHPVVSEGLAQYLVFTGRFELLWSCSDGDEALDYCEKRPPNVLLLDLKLPKRSGFELLPLIRKRYPDIRVAILTSFTQQEYIRNAYELGARAYFRKSMPLEQIAEGVLRVSRGEVVVCETDERIIGSAERLSQREAQILEMIAQGLSNKMIADRLEIMEGTVKAHTYNLFKKLRVNSRTEAIKAGFEHGLIEIDSL